MLVEDNPDDEALTVRALNKNKILNEVVVRTKLLPVVILTSSNEEQDRINGYGMGANSYVRKPVDFDQFVTAAAQLGLYWLVLNEAPPRRT